jgi:hypothetical protein
MARPTVLHRPADRPRAEVAVRRIFEAAAIAPPRHYCWFDSPFDAAWAVALLIEERHRVWRDLVSGARARRAERESIDRAAARLCEACGVPSLDAARAAVGPALGMSLQYPPAAVGLQSAIVTNRFRMRDPSAPFTVLNDADDLYRAESRLWGGNRGALTSGLLCPTAGTLIGQSFLADYSFCYMAGDEMAAGGRETPEILRAAWTAGDSMGPSWPFGNGAVMTDRPVEIHTNARALLQCEDGPAVVYRDGARVFAWNGLTVPEGWIMAPETLPSATFKGFDPTFRDWVKRRASRSRKTSARPAAGAIVDVELPADSEKRERVLRGHAGGTLPLFDRYVAGDRDAVWSELIALGDAVRADQHAADALAVAYETMRRVDLNVTTVVERLRTTGYRFGPAAGGARRPMSLFRRGRQEASSVHVAAGPRARAMRLEIEKRTGPLISQSAHSSRSSGQLI